MMLEKGCKSDIPRGHILGGVWEIQGVHLHFPGPTQQQQQQRESTQTVSCLEKVSLSQQFLISALIFAFECQSASSVKQSNHGKKEGIQGAEGEENQRQDHHIGGSCHCAGAVCIQLVFFLSNTDEKNRIDTSTSTSYTKKPPG